jgi:cyanamide hydratase
MSSLNPAIVKYGWTAVPRDVDLLLKQSEAGDTPAPALSVLDIPIPDSNLAKEVLAYAKRELSTETFNHSMRVYCFGMDVSHPLSMQFLGTSTKHFSYAMDEEVAVMGCLLMDEQDRQS